jgi:hypothetical protein
MRVFVASGLVGRRLIRPDRGHLLTAACCRGAMRADDRVPASSSTLELYVHVDKIPAAKRTPQTREQFRPVSAGCRSPDHAAAKPTQPAGPVSPPRRLTSESYDNPHAMRDGDPVIFALSALQRPFYCTVPKTALGLLWRNKRVTPRGLSFRGHAGDRRQTHAAGCKSKLGTLHTYVDPRSLNGAYPETQRIRHGRRPFSVRSACLGLLGDG